MRTFIVTEFLIPICTLVVCLAANPAVANDPPAGDASPIVLESGLEPNDVEKRPYAEYVAECIDLLIEHGTDRYGKVRSPVLMSILDVRTRACPESPLPFDERFRVIRRGRRAPDGAKTIIGPLPGPKRNLAPARAKKTSQAPARAQEEIGPRPGPRKERRSGPRPGPQ